MELSLLLEGQPDTEWFLQFASCLSVSGDFPNVLRTYAGFLWRKLSDFHVMDWSDLAQYLFQPQFEQH